ncbi:MAG: TRAM domain-containing protein [Armatimonadota bacterium]
MSARPLWVIFTICIMVIILWGVAKPILEWCVVSEIDTASIPYKTVSGIDAPDSDRVITKSDLTSRSFVEKWVLLYKFDPSRAIRLTLSILLAGLLGGFLAASVAFRHLVKFGDNMSAFSTTDKIAALLGGLIGIALSAIFLPVLLGDNRNPTIMLAGWFVITYVCITALMSMKEELKFHFPSLSGGSGGDNHYQKPKILDTNVIIDGRVADVCGAGFVEGRIIVPSFVLEELQHIADSSDSMRRARGRRGLDILNQMRKDLDLAVEQYSPVDPENPEEVDGRLVRLAQEIGGSIVTNDFNLNKVAQLQGVSVLNINELANALKPVVLPGEEMTVSVIKEGKEMNQGIAYLDDGTMVVVENAKRHIGETMDVVVTSVLQTVAGKMIFANIKAAQEEQDNLIDRNVRNYSGFRPRNKTS